MRKIVTIATKVIYQLYENRTDYDKDYDRYLNIYTMLTISKVQRTKLSIEAQEKLSELDEYFYSDIVNNSINSGYLLEDETIQCGQLEKENTSVEYIETIYHI